MLDALAASELAAFMRLSRWGYAAVSGAHVLGIALLVGAILPYDLRLLGFWPRASAAALGGVLRSTAAAGLALAPASGALLFLAAPAEYLAEPVFLVKLALDAAAGAHALSWRGAAPHKAARGARVRAAALSAGLWLGALVLGRALAFVGG
mgnify:CR=1 FL=1